MVKIKHQFLTEDFFIPTWDLKYLFLGTFNPEDGEKVSYFYGRTSRNYTWRVLSEIFNTKLEPGDDDFFKNIYKLRIGCMDVIRSVEVSDEHYDKIVGKGYSDSNLIQGRNNLEFNIKEINEVIDKNPGVKVFSTWGAGPKLKFWKNEIDKLAPFTTLVSPSGAARVPKGEKKCDYVLKDWKDKIL